MPCHLQVSTLEVDIAKVRSDLIAKDDELRELTQQASSDDKEASAEASAEVKKVKVEKNVLQAQLECKSRQLKVSICCFNPNCLHITTHTISHKTAVGLQYVLSSEFVSDSHYATQLQTAMQCLHVLFCMHVGILPDMFTSTVSKCGLASML